MTRITIDAATAAKLAGLDGTVELCDASGSPVGLFQPKVTHSTSENTPCISEEELDRFASEPGGRFLSEILSDLESRS